MREVRLLFSKTDRCKYISHLDINRCMSRALTRAQIPLWYTEGFNPHPYMSFSLPLPLGVESMCESLEIRITGDISNSEIKDKLNAVLPTGIRIVDVYDDFRDCSEIAFSDYVFKYDFKDNKEAEKRIKKVLSQDNIIALKRGKQGRRKILKEVDIKPLIDKCSVSVRDNSTVINARLAAGQHSNLSPELFSQTLLKLADLDFEWKSISRLALLDADYNNFR
jgi:radical SAM-linked protein